MNLRERCSGATSSCVRHLGVWCNRCVPACLRRHHRVAADSRGQDDDHEYLQLHPERRIRVVHRNPDDLTQPPSEEASVNCVPANEQYWFVRGSHCSYRLKKNKVKAKQQLEAVIQRDSVRYSFHKKEARRKSEDVQEVEFLSNEVSQKEVDVEKIANDLLDKVFEDALVAAKQKLQLAGEDSVDAVDVNIAIADSSYINEVYVSDEPKGETVKQFKKEPPSRNHKSANNQIKVPVKSSLKDGTAKKPIIMFLHGAGLSADTWTYLIEYFANNGYEVIAPDMLGHGFSSAPNSKKAYTFACLLQDALQIFDTYITGDKKCVLIAHGYGCSFGAAVTRYRPQSVAQLVMISGGGPTPLAPPNGIYSFPRFLLGCAKPLLMCGFRREYFYAPRGKNLIFCDNTDIPSNVLQYLRQGQHWPQGDSSFHRRIPIPTLLVHGMNDRCITLVEECEMERTIPRSFLEILPNCTHYAMQEVPDDLCHMIHCFINLWEKGKGLSK